ncbi:MAG: heme exporter protein CcmD [Hyphomicrobiaceae bacterium]|nr:heme exporter protein CcmD [Hyphomicrobiaceae bacterium]
MDLGPHAAFIIASYAAAIIVLTGLISWLVYEGAHQKRLLEDLEARGARRRSKSSAATKGTASQ